MTPQILKGQSTLSQPEGEYYAHHITTCPPPGFSDLPTALSSVHCTSTNTIDIKHQNSRMARQDTSSYITELSILCHGFDDMYLF